MSFAAELAPSFSPLPPNYEGEVSRQFPLQLDPALPIAGLPALSPHQPATLHATENLANRRRTHDRWGGFEVRFARDRRTRGDAFRLRHLCYTSKGYIDTRSNGQFSDEYDSVSANTTVVIYKASQPVGSVRICAMAPQARRKKLRHLPVSHVFPADLDALLTERKNAVEINRLVCDPAHDHNQGLVFVLMRMAYYVVSQQDPDFATSCVRTNHVPFYKRLRFEQLSEPRPYTGLKFMTTFMVARRETFDIVRRTVPMLQISSEAAGRYAGLWTGDTVEVFDQ